MKRRGFTLIELIVVITILSILWTIAFISLKWYTTEARDSVRLQNISMLENALSLSKVEVWTYYSPDNSFLVSWAVSLYEIGENWDNVRSNLKASDAYDPLGKENFIYSTSANWKDYNILGKFEKDSSLITSAHAEDESRIYKSFWTGAWVLLKTDYSKIDSNVTISSLTSSDNYKFITDSTEVVANQINLPTLLTHHSNSMLVNDSSLLIYYDMNSVRDGKLKNLAKNVNDWIFFGWVEVDWTSSISFDGVDDFIAIEGSETLAFNEITLIADVDIDSSVTTNANIVSSHENSGFGLIIVPGSNYKVAFSPHVNWSYRWLYSNEEFRPWIKSWIFAWIYGWTTVSMYVDWQKQTHTAWTWWGAITQVNDVPILIWANPKSMTWPWDYLSAFQASPFKGKIRSVRIFNRELSAKEIQMYLN